MFDSCGILAQGQLIYKADDNIVILQTKRSKTVTGPGFTVTAAEWSSGLIDTAVYEEATQENSVVLSKLKVEDLPRS